MNRYVLLTAFVWLAGLVSLFAQAFPQPDASRIRLQLRKLNVLGTVLYVAAHPDDENTLAIGYFANERLMNTGYLSLTRGDGGQNLIGTELRDKLGLIRTQELLAARRTDGGVQFFTRANDFGFSKGPAETLRIWEKDAVFSDVLKVIRTFRPDVIITRFPPDARAGHGHHTSSALLALEAFDKAADPAVLPDQVQKWGVWQPHRLYLNLSRFFVPEVNEKTPGVLTMDMGGYNPLLGQSYPELSAESRSMHKSQGFGSRARRGPLPEYFEHQKGARASADLLEGINTTWSRVAGGPAIEPMVNQAIASFRDETPWTIVPQLLKIRKAVAGLKDEFWKRRKIAEVDQLITDCLALFAEVTADQYYVSAGYPAGFTVEVVNRSGIPLVWNTLRIAGTPLDSVILQSIGAQQSVTWSRSVQVDPSRKNTPPYWLEEPHADGLFRVRDERLISTPENLPALEARFGFKVENDTLMVRVPVRYKSTDPVRGEVYRPVQVTPPVALNFSQDVLFFPAQKSLTVNLKAQSQVNARITGKVKLKVPEGWVCDPAEMELMFSKRGEVRDIRITITPPGAESRTALRAEIIGDGFSGSTGLEEIRYDHIPVQTLQPPAEVRLVRATVNINGRTVGYIPGAGDEIPDALRAMGYQVTLLGAEETRLEVLRKFDAVVLGIRAFNTNEVLRERYVDLHAYVREGGTVVVQYNTTGDLSPAKFAPFDLTLGRERVTEENTEVRFLAPGHPVLQKPNAITERDFEGWVQERGLYFAASWAPEFTPILSANDAGEPARNGGLLVAQSGKGYFLYTGLSFFRQLPEGVPGAYRLFANLVSLRKPEEPKPVQQDSKRKKK